MKLDCTKLRKLRDKRKISQFELGDALELSQSTIAKYEKGNCDVKFNTLISLCTYFGVNPNELLTESSIPPPSNMHQVKNQHLKSKISESDLKDFIYEEEKLKIASRLVAVLEKLL